MGKLASLYVSTHSDGFERRQSEHGTVAMTVDYIIPYRRTPLSKTESSQGVHPVRKEHGYGIRSSSGEIMNL